MLEHEWIGQMYIVHEDGGELFRLPVFVPRGYRNNTLARAVIKVFNKEVCASTTIKWKRIGIESVPIIGDIGPWGSGEPTSGERVGITRGTPPHSPVGRTKPDPVRNADGSASHPAESDFGV